MAMANNVVVLTGNLTADPDAPRPVGEFVVTRARLAVNGRKRKDGTEDTLYVDLEIWGKGGEVLAQYAKKGKTIQVSGELKMDAWDDKATGQKRTKLYVKADDFRFVGGPQDDKGGDDTPAAPPAKAAGKAAPVKGGKKPAPAEGFEGDDAKIPF